MNCHIPLAPTRDTAVGLKPLSIIAVKARSSGNPLALKTSKIIPRYCPERRTHRPTTSRRTVVNRSTKYFTCEFIEIVYVGTCTSRNDCPWSRDDSANAYAQGSKYSGTTTDESSCKPGSSVFVSSDGRVNSSFDGDGMETSRKSRDGDCDSAQTGERAIGEIIPTKLANNSRKEARIAISEDLIVCITHRPNRSTAHMRRRGRITINLDIGQVSWTLKTRINVSIKPSYGP